MLFRMGTLGLFLVPLVWAAPRLPSGGRVAFVLACLTASGAAYAFALGGASLAVGGSSAAYRAGRAYRVANGALLAFVCLVLTGVALVTLADKVLPGKF